MEELESKTLVQLPLDIPIHKRDVGFACLDRAPLSQALRAFFEVCQIGTR